MWSISKPLLIPFDKTIKTAKDIPHTISYVIRKRQQVEALFELPKDKRPPDWILWHSNPDKLTEWLDKVLGKDNKKEDTGTMNVSMNEIEG